jgi:hypothetical protein
MKYRNRFPEPGTTISGFADSKKKINTDRPTDRRFFWNVTVKTHFLGPYYMLGRRRNCNIIHTRLWHQCSSLGADLFKANIIIDPSCPCRCPLEDAMHYLLQCPLYRNAIMQLFINITPHYFENWEPGWHNELGSWIT